MKIFVHASTSLNRGGEVGMGQNKTEGSQSQNGARSGMARF
jgi:hypothetical protein